MMKSSDDADQKAKLAPITVRASEKARAEREARAAGMDLASWVRAKCGFSHPSGPAPSAEDEQVTTSGRG